MCSTLYEGLGSTGRTMGIACFMSSNPGGAVTCCEVYTGFSNTLAEGEAYHIHFKEQSDGITNYNWSMNNYQSAMASAGFSNVQWHNPGFEPNGPLTKALSTKDIQQLIDFPVFRAITADKAG